jgi:hypothetical protein
MRYEWAVGETGHRGRISHLSAQPISQPPITNCHALFTAFLIDTPAIRNASNSFDMSESSRSNRHSSGTSPAPNFASRTTLPEVLYLHPNLLCYSRRVTRVPPIGPRESAPARSHGYGVVVSSPRNGSFTGAFPHKFNRSTGLIGSAGLFCAPLVNMAAIKDMPHLLGQWDFVCRNPPLTKKMWKRRCRALHNANR